MNVKKLWYVVVLIFSYEYSHCRNYYGVISIPKCGTHLTLKIMELITGIRNHTGPVGWCVMDDTTIQKMMLRNLLLKTHAIYIEENIKILSLNNLKKIFIYRDPRDQIVSAAFWIKKRPKEWPLHSQWSIPQIITELIAGGGQIWSTIFLSRADHLWQSLNGITSFYNLYLPWQFEPDVYTTQFEKIVGSKGGGNSEIQLQEIMNIAQHMGHPITTNHAKLIADRLFGGTLTFREGKIGAWKKHFTQEHKEAFKEIAGQLLIDLGYEQNFDW